jgi:hypothetical protein
LAFIATGFAGSLTGRTSFATEFAAGATECPNHPTGLAFSQPEPEIWLTERAIFLRRCSPCLPGAPICREDASFSYRARPFIYQKILYDLNPMVGVIDGFRWSISKGRVSFRSDSLALSPIAVALLPVSGIWYFHKTERTFADVI